MSDTIVKQLISAVAASWNERAVTLLDAPSSVSLVASRDVSGEGIEAALAVAMTWPMAFATRCEGAEGGVLLCLLKNDEAEKIDRMVKTETDGLPRPGSRALINAIFEGAAANQPADAPEQFSFTPVIHIDLAMDLQRLGSIVKDKAHIGTFSLTIGNEINTQALMVYAPNGELTEAPSTSVSAGELPTAYAELSSFPDHPQNSDQKRKEPAPRNIERLLDVELDVIVRFGITTVPLRDIVRMGVGTMIELNRAVDEPVELLVNGRSLARGEVVVVDGYYGVRITEIGPPAERAASIV